jgi:Mce-associated membrane protein
VRATKALWRPLTIALVLALAAAGVLAFTERQRGSSPSANRALLDSEATAKAVGDVSNALVKIFSYRPGDVAATEKAAAELLEGKAAQQYRGLFGQVRQQAPAQQLSLTTRVVRAGVSRMSADTAHLLVFLDQASTRKGVPAGGTAAAQLAVTAHLRDGQWRIAEIRSS